MLFIFLAFPKLSQVEEILNATFRNLQVLALPLPYFFQTQPRSKGRQNFFGKRPVRIHMQGVVGVEERNLRLTDYAHDPLSVIILPELILKLNLLRSHLHQLFQYQ